MSTTSVDNFGSISIEELTDLIRVAEMTERYTDMSKYVKQLVLLKTSKGEDLTTEERNLLSVAYKNVVGACRGAWRTLSGGFEDTNEELTQKYQTVIEDEITALCNELIGLVVDNILPIVDGLNNEVEVFYLKLTGDYCRYLSEFQPKNEELKTKGENYYSKALKIARSNLAETHPTRLGLALNYSVFQFEIQNEPEKACELAKTSFDAAIEKLELINDRSYKDATLIMQLLRDNLTLWTSEINEEEKS